MNKHSYCLVCNVKGGHSDECSLGIFARQGIYRVIRFYQNEQTPRTIKQGLTLSEAQAHCKRPDTRKEGVWFDGYDYMKGIKLQEASRR